MSLLATLVGAILIIVALSDIFQTLFHPSGKGSLSRTLIYGIWKATRLVVSRYPRVLQLAGPLGFLVTLAAWTVLLTLGWAFVYWPHLPNGFSFDPGMDPSRNAGFSSALYFSIVSLATLGYGDIVPDAKWLRIIAPAQALTGFGLLTASITWLLLIFPALSYRRAFADNAVSAEVDRESQRCRMRSGSTYAGYDATRRGREVLHHGRVTLSWPPALDPNGAGHRSLCP